MGIKFRCPNGHKLNVKSFLAGKRGVCPDCGQTFRIPPEDLDDKDYVAMPLESRRNGAPADVTVDRLDESEFETSVAVAAAAVAEPLPLPPARLAEAPFYIGPDSVPSPAEQAPAPTSSPASPPRPPTPVVPPAPVDPIAEAPAAVWYVRPPSGGQYGPAKGDVLRKWIAEGRVSADSLVWREDWTDWRDAGKHFPTLASANPAAAGGAAKSPAAGGVFPTPTSLPATPTTAPRPADRKPVKKKSNSDMAVAALVCLVLVCLILVTVLVIVLSRGSA